MHTDYINIVIYIYIVSIISHYIIFTVDITILIRIRQVATLFLTARRRQQGRLGSGTGLLGCLCFIRPSQLSK